MPFCKAKNIKHQYGNNAMQFSLRGRVNEVEEEEKRGEEVTGIINIQFQGHLCSSGKYKGILKPRAV